MAGALVAIDQLPFWVQSQDDSGRWHVFALGGSTTYGDPFDASPNFTALALRHLGIEDDNEAKLHLFAGPALTLEQNLLKLKDHLMYRAPKHGVIVLYTGVNECFREDKTYWMFRYGLHRVPLFYHIVNVWNRWTKKNLVEGVNSLGVFEAQYREVFRIARRHGYKVITVKPAGNIYDYEPDASPWSSVSRRQVEELLAQGPDAIFDQLPAYRAQGNENFLKFVYAKSLENSGREAEAHQAYIEAADYHCSYVPNQAKRQVVHNISAENGVTAIDAWTLIESVSPTGRLDQGAFFDAHHPRLEGVYEISVQVAKQMASVLDRTMEVFPISSVLSEELNKKKWNSIWFTRALWYATNMLKSSTGYADRRALFASEYLDQYHPEDERRHQLKKYLEIVISLHRGLCSQAKDRLLAFQGGAQLWSNVFELEGHSQKMAESTLFYAQQCRWKPSLLTSLQNLSAQFQAP